MGERIVQAAQEKGLSTTRLAALLGVKPSQISAWRNDGSVPGGYHLVRIAEALGVTTDWLLGVDGAPQHRGQAMTDEERIAHVMAQVQQTFAFGLPQLMSRGAEEMWRPIGEVLERNLKEQGRDPDKMLREMFGVEPLSHDERRSFFIALLAAGIQELRHRRRRRWDAGESEGGGEG